MPPPRWVARSFFFFFFNDTATTEIYTLSLRDALPICWRYPAKENRGVYIPIWGPRRAQLQANRVVDKPATTLARCTGEWATRSRRAHSSLQQHWPVARVNGRDGNVLPNNIDTPQGNRMLSSRKIGLK